MITIHWFLYTSTSLYKCRLDVQLSLWPGHTWDTPWPGQTWDSPWPGHTWGSPWLGHTWDSP